MKDNPFADSQICSLTLCIYYQIVEVTQNVRFDGFMIWGIWVNTFSSKLKLHALFLMNLKIKKYYCLKWEFFLVPHLSDHLSFCLNSLWLWENFILQSSPFHVWTTRIVRIYFLCSWRSFLLISLWVLVFPDTT